MIITVVQGPGLAKEKSRFGFSEATVTNLVDEHIINKGKIYISALNIHIYIYININPYAYANIYNKNKNKHLYK